MNLLALYLELYIFTVLNHKHNLIGHKRKAFKIKIPYFIFFFLLRFPVHISSICPGLPRLDQLFIKLVISSILNFTRHHKGQLLLHSFERSSSFLFLFFFFCFCFQSWKCWISNSWLGNITNLVYTKLVSSVHCCLEMIGEYYLIL